MSLIFLLALWAAGLIVGFALLQYGAGGHLQLNNEPLTFGRLLYHSGETFFTLGYGDIVPNSGMARALSVLEAGMGFGFLGTVIGYLPTIYSSFSRREIEISLLDARAGSPPTAAELLMRLGSSPRQDVLDQVFRDWERWAAELLESHLSYPALSFFRSQHNNQSWLGALTTILDTTALVIAGVEGIASEQAKITFAIARHASVDLAQVVKARYDPDDSGPLAGSRARALAAGSGGTGSAAAGGRRSRAKVGATARALRTLCPGGGAQPAHYGAPVDSSRKEQGQLASRTVGSGDPGQGSGGAGAAETGRRREPTNISRSGEVPAEATHLPGRSRSARDAPGRASARTRVSIPSMRHGGEKVVRIEAEALRALADRIAGPMAPAFDCAVELLGGCTGRVVVTGMGKSGIIARKIVATLSSTGTPALFLHPVEALHGDLGMVVRGDVVLALSASGETEEILRLLATLKRLQVPLIAMTCDARRARRGSFHFGRGRRHRSRLFCRQRGLLSRVCSHRFHHNHAGPRGRVGGRAVREARFQGG